MPRQNPHFYNQDEEIDLAVAAVDEILASMQAGPPGNPEASTGNSVQADYFTFLTDRPLLAERQGFRASILKNRLAP